MGGGSGEEEQVVVDLVADFARDEEDGWELCRHCDWFCLGREMCLVLLKGLLWMLKVNVRDL